MFKDDRKLAELERQCYEDGNMCGECKKELTERINKFLAEHQKKREKPETQWTNTT